MAETKPIRCPNWPNDKDLRSGEEVILGCGSTNVEGPHTDGTYDCLDCGIYFLPEEEPEGWGKDLTPSAQNEMRNEP